MRNIYQISILFFLTAFVSVTSAGNIDGFVSDALTGTPVAKAQITALNISPDLPDSLFYSTISEEDGEYHLENLVPGTYMIWCEHPEYQYQKSMDIIIEDGTSLKLNFTLHKKNSGHHSLVSGHVFSQPPMLPVIIPLPSATVYLQSGNITFNTISDSTGYYLFSNIQPGKYLVSAEAAGHQKKTNIDTILVEEGTKIENLDIYLTPEELNPSSSLSGKVYEEESNQPVHPAYITLIPNNPYFSEGPLPFLDGLEISVLNNPDGSYLIEDIPPGFYTIMCTAKEYITLFYRDIKFYAQEMSMDFALKRLDPNQTNLLSGFVYDADNEKPLTAANINLINLNGPEIFFHTFTDGSGYYQFHSILPGEYEATFFKHGYYPFRNTIEIDENSWITDFNAYLKPYTPVEPITVWGYVWEQTPDILSSYPVKPVYPAKIKIIGINSAGDSLIYTTQNNPDGSYKISNVRPGYYTLKCSSEGYKTQVYQNVYLHLPEHCVDFYLTPICVPQWGYITGKVYFDDDITHDDVYDENNIPVQGALITFISSNLIYHRTYTNEFGEYKARLPVGKYIVSCIYQSPDSMFYYQEYYDNVHSIAEATPVPVYANEITMDINFGIPFPSVVSKVKFTGRVTDNNGIPLEKALVRVGQIFRSNVWLSSNAFSAYTDEQGFYEISIEFYWITIPNPPIPFIVFAEKPGYKIEFYKEKATCHEADILWAFTDTTFRDIDFTLDPVSLPNSISGKVSSENGQPLANAFVIGSAASSGEIVFTFTNNEGAYQLNNLRKDYYYLLFAANGHIPEFYDNVRFWEDATPVFASGEVTGIDAELTPIIVPYDSSGCILAGTVVDESGNPLSGVLITVNTSDSKVAAYDFTDSKGAYELNWIGNGRHLVSASKVNYASESAWINLDNSVSQVNLLNFTLSQSFTSLPGTVDRQYTIPTTVELLSNYPNPFNPITYIQFSIPHNQHVQLTIYDLLGRKIRELLNRDVDRGLHSITWNGTDESGNAVSSGIYFYVLDTPDKSRVRKMILSR